jgi:hypothetical protein
MTATPPAPTFTINSKARNKNYVSPACQVYDLLAEIQNRMLELAERCGWKKAHVSVRSFVPNERFLIWTRNGNLDESAVAGGHALDPMRYKIIDRKIFAFVIDTNKDGSPRVFVPLLTLSQLITPNMRKAIVLLNSEVLYKHVQHWNKIRQASAAVNS